MPLAPAILLLLVAAMTKGTAHGAVLQDLGHTSRIWYVNKSGDRLLTMSFDRVWKVWDTHSRNVVLRGTADAVQLEGTTILTRSGKNINILDAVTGKQLNGCLCDFTQAGLSADGEAFWLASGASFQAFTKTGARLIVSQGDYSRIQVLAIPGKLDVFLVSKDSLEQWDLATKSKTRSKYTGTFHNWFSDKRRFITSQGGFGRIYDINGKQERIFENNQDDELGGWGDWYWRNARHQPGYKVSVYKLSGGQDPVTTLDGVDEPVAASGGYLISISKSVRLRVDSLVESEWKGPRTNQWLYVTGGPGWSGPLGYSATVVVDDSAQWYGGGDDGAIVTGNFKSAEWNGTPFTLGSPASLSASRNGIFAAAFPSGKILVYRAEADSAILVASLDAYASLVKVSPDGKMLAFKSMPRQPPFDQYHRAHIDSLYLYSVGKGEYVKAIPFSENDTTLFDFDFSFDGTGISLRTGTWNGNFWTFVSKVLTDPWDAPSFSYQELQGHIDLDVVTYPYRAYSLSPDGKTIVGMGTDKTYAKIIRDGVLIDAVPGLPLGWLTDGGFASVTTGNLLTVYDAKGGKRNTYPIPVSFGPLYNWLTLRSDSWIYCGTNHSLFDFKTGKTLFSLSTDPQFTGIWGQSTPVNDRQVAYVSQSLLEIRGWNTSGIAVRPAQRVSGKERPRLVVDLRRGRIGIVRPGSNAGSGTLDIAGRSGF